nr:hypothetical protein [Tanacetum cinerariifolium]
MTKSSSTSLNSLLEETNTFNNSLPEFETFCFDVEEISSGSTTYFSNSLLEEFTDELTLITYPPDYDDNLQFDIEFDLKKIEFLLYQGKDSSLKDLIIQTDLANLDAIFVDPIPEMFTDEHALDYSSPSRFDVYEYDFLEVESDAENVYNDPFDSKGEKIKESKLLIDELDLPCDFLPYSEYDSFNSQDFSRVDALPSTNNEDKVFNPGILIQEKPIKIITRVAQDKKLAIPNASLMLKDFDPPFYELLFLKDVPKSKMLLLFSSENEKKVFKLGIYTSEKVKVKQEKDKIKTKPDQIKTKTGSVEKPDSVEGQSQTMDTTIDQQVAIDEALVLRAQRDMLHIFSRVHGQTFVEPPFEEEILAFIWFLGHSVPIRMLTDININKLYQPWRSFVANINKCLTGKSSGYDSLRLSQAQILWGLYHKRNVDYAYLMWEDFVYQVEHKNQKKSNEMYYPRFTKVIIHHFMSKDPSISRRNKVNWHYVRDDFMFSTIKLVSRHLNTQQFGALLPIELTNDEIRNSNAYKEYYAVTTEEAAPKPKASVRRTRSGSDTSITPPTVAASPRLTASAKGKQTAKAFKAKSLSALSEVAIIEAQQLKLVTKRSRQQMHISQASGSGADEGTGSIPGVLDVPIDESEKELS